MLQNAAIIVFLLGLLVSGVLGTETRLLFFWPGAILLGLAGLLAVLRWRLRVFFPPNDVCLASSLIFLGYMLWRVTASPVVAYAREDGVILLSCFVTYILTVTALSHPSWRRALIVVLLLIMLGNLAVASVHLSGNWGFHVIPHFFRPGEPGRIGGFFANANHLAASLSVTFFLTAGWLFFGRGGATLKLCLAFGCVLMATGISLTVSRGAMIGLMAGTLSFATLALWVVWHTQRQLFGALFGGGFALVLLGVVILWEVNEEYLRGRAERLSMSQDIRLGIWEAALAQYAESPWFGAGARGFYDGGTKFRSERLPSWAAEPLFAHNEYLQLFADYGRMGGLVLLFMLLAHAGNGFRYIGWFARERFLHTGRLLSMNLALCLGGIAGLVATLVHAFFEFHFHVPTCALSGALLLGILANPGFESMDRLQRRLPGIRVFTKLALSIASVTLLACAYYFGRGDYNFAHATLAQARKDETTRRRYLDAAARLDPANPEIFYQSALQRMGNVTRRDLDGGLKLKLALDELDNAVILNPGNYLYHLARADVCDALSRHEEALASISNALVLAPLHEEPRLALGMHWHRLTEWHKAELAYMWARDALAMNKKGTANWISAYRIMLEHVALSRDREIKVPRMNSPVTLEKKNTTE